MYILYYIPMTILMIRIFFRILTTLCFHPFNPPVYATEIFVNYIKYIST